MIFSALSGWKILGAYRNHLITLIHVGYLISTTFLLSCVSLTQFIAEYGENLGVAYDIWYHLNSWSKLKLDYKWIVGDWSECSATCARGKLRRMHYRFPGTKNLALSPKNSLWLGRESISVRYTMVWGSPPCGKLLTFLLFPALGKNEYHLS